MNTPVYLYYTVNGDQLTDDFTLQDYTNGAQGIAFQARVKDDQDVPIDWASYIRMTFVLAYEFPELDCPSRLYWEVDPSVYLPNGLEIESAESNTEPYVSFELYIVEDPSGLATFPAVVEQFKNPSSRRDTASYTNTFTTPKGVFLDKQTGSFVVPEGRTSNLFVGLTVLLWAPLSKDYVCIGCSGYGSARGSKFNELLECARFTVVGPGSGDNYGPFWYTEPLSN